MDTPPHLLFGILIALIVLGLVMMIPRRTRIIGLVMLIGALGMYIGVSLKKSQWNPWKWDGASTGSGCTAATVESDVNPLGAETFQVESDGDCVIATCSNGYTIASDFKSCKAGKKGRPN